MPRPNSGARGSQLPVPKGYNLRSVSSSSDADTMPTFTDEQFAELLQRLSVGVATPPPPREGNFSNCSARFTAADTDDVDAFIDAVETFKSCSRVSDDNALKGLSMLVEGSAAVWWQGIKPTVTTWPDAVRALKSSFSRRLPPHLLFREIFKREQLNNESTDLFICRARALFAQLPYTLPERAQVDMAYGLLRSDLRQRIKPQETFESLLREAHDVEISFRESSFEMPSASVTGMKRDVKVESSVETRVRCRYCRAVGHTRDSCDRLLKKASTTSPTAEYPVASPNRNKKQVVCYGCGAPNVIKTKCPRCNANAAGAPASLNLLTLHQLSVRETSSDSKLLIPIQIGEISVFGHADTGAQVSVAGAQLYKALLDAGYSFNPSHVRLSFADGEIRSEDILQVSVEVVIAGKTVPTVFMVFPRFRCNHTLLGVDFLTKADIVLNIPRNCWYFHGSFDVPLPFGKLPTAVERKLPDDVTECFELSLRGEEGEGLDVGQRSGLNALLDRHQMTFQPGGEPTNVADALSRPFAEAAPTEEKNICFVSVEFPTYGADEFRRKQLDDPEVAKIISGLEGDNAAETLRWAERGYVLSNAVLYRSHPDAATEEPQLVVPSSLREDLLKAYHDAPTAGHYGAERTFQKIAAKFHFSGMRRYIADYVKGCTACQKYKPSNLKPAGLLQTPAPSQRFEVLAIDFFGPLPETSTGNKWILLVEDLASRWTEVFALQEATAEATAKILIEEIFLRYGTPRKIICDNGVQFVSAIMQKVTFCFGIELPFIPAYHPESNPVERKNRDLKTQLSILVKNRHDMWDAYISSIRFALNSTMCESLGQTPAYLTYGRQLRAPHDNVYDLRQVVAADNFVPRITPYLKGMSAVLCEAHEVMTKQQDRHKKIADVKRQPADFKVGDLVLLATHVLSNSSKRRTSKFAPKRDGPYLVTKVITPSTFQLATNDSKRTDIGRHHASRLTLFQVAEGAEIAPPIVPVRRRGRPRKDVLPAAGDRSCGQRGSV